MRFIFQEKALGLFPFRMNISFVPPCHFARIAMLFFRLCLTVSALSKGLSASPKAGGWPYATYPQQAC